MINNSAYWNPLMSVQWLTPPIYLQNQTQDLDANNNDKNEKLENSSGVCYIYTDQGDDHHRDGITQVQERSTDDSQRYYVQTSHNVKIKTDDDCIATSRTSPPEESQSTNESTQKTVETMDNVTTMELTDQTLTVQTSAMDMDEQMQDMDESDILQPRPMNAFLLFCKVHRRLVRKKYKVENRIITKKLGVWWRLLTKEEKLPFQKLSKEHKDKLYAINPNFQWSKKVNVPAKAQVSTRTKDGSANTSLTVPETDPMNVPDDTISIKRLEAAEALVRLHESGEIRPLTTFKLADESDMGSLKELCIGIGTQQTGARAAASQIWESRGNQSSQVAPGTSDFVLDVVADQTGVGPSTQRATRTCKGKLYNDFMSHMLPRAQSKRATTAKKSPKAPSKQRRTGKAQTAIVNGDTPNQILIKATIGELRKELLAKIRSLPVMSIDHFVSMQNSDKKRKKPQESISNAQIQFASTSQHQGDVPAVIVVKDNTVGSAPIATIATPKTAVSITVEALAMVQPTHTKLVGSSKRKSPKERITHHPQSAMVERQTILICHTSETSDGANHARAGQLDNPMTFQ